MSWLKIILGAIANFLKWRAQATDPTVKAQATYEEEHKEWKQKLERLEREESEVNTVIENRIAGHIPDKRDPYRIWTILELQTMVEERRAAVTACRREEPRNPSVQQG